MRFAYRPFAAEAVPGDSSRVLYRPVIPIQLGGDRGRLVFVGLLDTGADQTLINAEVARQIGAKPIEGSSFTMMSPNGQFDVQAARVRVRIQQAPEHYEWTAVVGVLDQPWPDAVLGQVGFLEFFDASFRSGSQEILLDRNQRPLPDS